MQALHTSILQSITDEYPRNSEASVVELSDGRLLMAWSQFLAGTTDWTEARISARLSSDRGRSWGDFFVLQEIIGEMCTYSPSLLRLHSGSLGLAFFVKNSKGDNRVFWRNSTDEGENWSSAIAITPTPAYYVINNDRVIQLLNGRLLAPIAYVPQFVDHMTPFSSFCSWSDDEGQTWQRGSDEVSLPKRGALEPGLVERGDGSVLMFIRTQMGSAYRAVSHDQGESWSDVRSIGAVASEAPTCIKRIPSTGDLLMIWNHVWDPYRSHWGRSPLAAAVSSDDGETWHNLHNIEEDPGHTYSYTSITFVDDEVVLTYYRGRAVERGTQATSGVELMIGIYPVSGFYEASVSWKAKGKMPFEKGR